MSTFIAEKVKSRLYNKMRKYDKEEKDGDKAGPETSAIKSS